MGRKIFSGLTLPKCQRLSSMARCLTATCALASRCCILQPPQAPACKPKCGQPGRTRCEDSCTTSSKEPCSQLFFLRWMLARTASNGSAPSTKTTLPSSRCATPCASRSIDSICSTLSVINWRANIWLGRRVYLGDGFQNATSPDRHRYYPSRQFFGRA